MKYKMQFRRENSAAGMFFAVVYGIALGISEMGYPIAAGGILLLAACLLYGYLSVKRKCLADLTALLSLFWIGGLGLGIMRLSKLHTPWTWQSMVCFGGFYLMYLIGDGIHTSVQAPSVSGQKTRSEQLDRLYHCILAAAVISTLTFWTEAGILGYIPIFSEDTHAYNTFHVTGLHYFTVSCMMTHALSVIYLMECREEKKAVSRKNVIGLAASNLLSLSVAVMCISKLQFLLIIGLPVLIILRLMRVSSVKQLPWKRICLIGGILLAVAAGVMVLFTVFRHYEAGYLNDIFEFRNPDVPIWLQYPYMYVANNFANFNCLTENLKEYTFGLKQLFPVFALTGLKFVFPSLVNFPGYNVKEEINTLTIIYDAYYDIGIIGVLGFGFLLGTAASWITKRAEAQRSIITVLLYGQVAVYMVLSFFSAWYSVATTWFWFAITGLIYLYVSGFGRNGSQKG